MTIRISQRSAEKLGFAKRSQRTANLQKIDLILDDVATARGIEVFRELAFAKDTLGRAWRFDRYIPKLRIAIEYEGGAGFDKGHTAPGPFAEDAEKYAAAYLLGWNVIRVPPKFLESGLARLIIENAVSREVSRRAVYLNGDPAGGTEWAQRQFAAAYRAFHARRKAAQAIRKGKTTKGLRVKAR